MEQATTAVLVDDARDAVSRCDWEAACHALLEADAGTPLAFDELMLLAEVAYASGDLDTTIEVLERAHADRLAADEPLGAATAATRIAMHLMMDTGLMAPVRAWIKRAERLLDGQQEAGVHAWLAVAKTYERLLSGDFSAAQQWARQAATIGAAQDAPAPHAMGRVAEARGAILAGDVQRGLDLLDEAAVVAMSGEVDPLNVGLLYCELVCAWQGLAQYERAEEWTEAMERWCQGHSMGSVQGRCRVHRAEILRLRGHCDEAEREALAACDELRPILRREYGWPLTELGRIRLQKGDLDGAEAAFREAYDAGWEPQPGYAQLLLARGDVVAAAASIDNALDHPLDIPSKELPPDTGLRRAPLLAAQVEIGIAAGDLERAVESAAELGRIAIAFDSDALRARAAVACGQVHLAQGDLADARAEFDRAVGMWTRLAAPFESGQARMWLGHVYRQEGHEQNALREFGSAHASFDRVGARHSARQAATARGVSATDVPGRVDTDGPSIFCREGDYWSLVFRGKTTRLRDLRGLQYLARLLAAPGREFHATDLVALELDTRPDGGGPAAAGLRATRSSDAGELLDAQAKAAYRRRLLEVEQDIEEAQGNGDAERASRAEVDRDFLVRELARAVGMGGRDRRAGSASERSRASVTRAVRHAMKRIQEHHPTLGEHLERTVRTGTYCAYLPDPRVPADWKTELTRPS